MLIKNNRKREKRREQKKKIEEKRRKIIMNTFDEPDKFLNSKNFKIMIDTPCRYNYNCWCQKREFNVTLQEKISEINEKEQIKECLK